MGLSIYFDGEHEFMAEKIHYIVINGFLPQELETTYLSSLELIPKQHFRKSASIAKLSCEDFKLWIVVQYLFSSH